MFARHRGRIQQAIVEIDEASSGFLQFVGMAFRGDQRSELVHRHRDPLLACAAPNADPVPGRLHLPSARDLLSQHSLTWDEWSSPGELIHPGDLASITRITSSEGELDFAIALMAIREEAPGNRDGGDSLHRDDGRVTTAGRRGMGESVQCQQVGLENGWHKAGCRTRRNYRHKQKCEMCWSPT